MKKQSMRFVSLILLFTTMLSVFSGCIHVHDYGKWEVEEEATCTKDGLKVRVCECGDEDTKTIQALGHEDGEWKVVEEATCTKDGKKELLCDSCKEVVRTEVITANGTHTYTGRVTKEATCQQDGTTTYTCSSCKDSYTEPLICKSYTSTEVHDLYVNSVGEVITYDRSGNEYALGTCFVYSQDGRIITNYHVIEGAYSAKITLAGKTYDVMQVLAYDKNIDVAVLKISASGLTVSKLCESEHKVGATVYAFGNSKGLTSTFSDGMITYSNRVLDGVAYVQHDAPISSGNSGGPLINSYGEVIGINTWTVRESQNLNFAISVKELKKLSYSNPLTMAEFYEKECDVFTRMKNYIMENGSYNSTDGYYRLVLGIDYSSDYTTKFTRAAYYYVGDDEITLDSYADDGDYYAYFTIDNTVSGVYNWNYFDKYDYTMKGTLYASTYSSSSLLGYSSHNLTTTSLRDSVRQLASNLIGMACLSIAMDFAEIGITADDLHFYYF